MPGTKVLALPGGPVPVNHHIVELIDEIKPKIRELIDYANKVSFTVPVDNQLSVLTEQPKGYLI